MRGMADGVLIDGVGGAFVVVVGGRDNCNYYRGSATGAVLVTKYPDCPATFALAQDAGANGRDLCIKTTLSWVEPLVVPH